jgi:translation initiation factor 3 subunit C
MHATKSLTKGDWESCFQSIKKLRLWESVKANAGGEAVKNHVQSLLYQRIKEEALRTYLLTYSAHFMHIQHEHLASMFELDKAVVQRVASSLMVNESLHASWDEPAGLLVIEQKLTNKLQKMAINFTDKALVFLDQNERLLDSRPQDRERRERAERAEQKEGQAEGGQRNALAGRFRARGGAGGDADVEDAVEGVADAEVAQVESSSSTAFPAFACVFIECFISHLERAAMLLVQEQLFSVKHMFLVARKS